MTKPTTNYYATTQKRPFGFMRNFEWFVFDGLIGHNTIWVRVYPIPYGLEITKKSPLKGRQLLKDWSFRFRRATDSQ